MFQKSEKLCLSTEDKTGQVIHYRYLTLLSKLGVQIEITGGIKFTESPFLASWIGTII